jgi:membrane protein
MSIKKAWTITKKTFANFFETNCLKLSASLAFFTVFSLPGLLIIIIWVSQLIYGRELVAASIFRQLEDYLGPNAAENLHHTIKSAAIAGTGPLATIIGLVTLIFGATSVFGDIQNSINRIWKLKSKPKKGQGLMKLIFDRFISFSMIISLAFIMLISLILNGVMDYLLNGFMERYPHVTVLLVYIIHEVITFFITALIFGAIFKVLPDAVVKWKHVRTGAVITAVLFVFGRFGIEYLLSQNQMTTVYGAAGSVIVVLLWVFYSAMILYFGATLTHILVIEKGSRIYPNKYAVWIQEIEVESKESVANQPVQKTVVEVPGKPV